MKKIAILAAALACMIISADCQTPINRRPGRTVEDSQPKSEESNKARAEAKSESEKRDQEHIRRQIESAKASMPEWRRGESTNGVTVTVCVGTSDGELGIRRPATPAFLLFRDMTFDAEGRLVRVSSLSKVIIDWRICASGDADAVLEKVSEKWEKLKNMEAVSREREERELEQLRQRLRRRHPAR